MRCYAREVAGRSSLDMNLKLESTYPLIGGVLSGMLWAWLGPRFPVDEKEFLAAALSLGAILTGFITTAKAILAALPSDSVMKWLHSSGYVKYLVLYLEQALYGCLAFSVFCLLGFFFLETGKIVLPKWYAATWIALGVFGGLSFFRVSRLLFSIIKTNRPA